MKRLDDRTVRQRAWHRSADFFGKSHEKARKKLSGITCFHSLRSRILNKPARGTAQRITIGSATF
jgi:hypothetical protein